MEWRRDLVMLLGGLFLIGKSTGGISRFVDDNPTIKMLALAFLLWVGVVLIAESFDRHLPKGYIYFAMAFSLFVEMLNLRMAKKQDTPIRS